MNRLFRASLMSQPQQGAVLPFISAYDVFSASIVDSVLQLAPAAGSWRFPRHLQ